MARIAGVNLPQQKQVWVALTHIYGIGRTRAYKICDDLKINSMTKVKDLTDSEVTDLNNHIQKAYEIEGDLRRRTAMRKKFLKDIRCQRGIRAFQGLPVRGQRSKTNAKTAKRRGSARKQAA